MSNDKIRQYILAAGEDKAIQDVGLYEHPQQVYMLGASVAVALVMADWIDADRIKDARIANLQSAPQWKRLKWVKDGDYFLLEESVLLPDSLDFYIEVEAESDCPFVLYCDSVWQGEYSALSEAKTQANKIYQEEISKLLFSQADLAYNAEFERIQTAAKRYETLRTLNPRQFADLYAKNLETGVAFDDLVDAIGKESK